MNPRIAALLETLTRSAQQQLRKTMAATHVNAFDGDYELHKLGDTPPFPGTGNRYDLYLYPAISELPIVSGCRELQYTFVTFRPTGDVLHRRDAEERTRVPGTPNQAVVEICNDLDPSSPVGSWLVSELTTDLTTFWPHRRFTFLVAAASADLEACFVFGDVESFKHVALDAGRRAAA